jgi:site-specific recombinase XerD
MRNSASAKPILYLQKTLKNGKHPIMIQIIKNRKVRRISLGYSALPSEWDSKHSKPTKKHPNQLELQAVLNKKMAEFSKQVLSFDLENKTYTTDTIIKTVKKKRSVASVIKYFDEVITQLKGANKIGNAEHYQTCKNVLFTFNNQKDLTFVDIDYSFLTKLENYCHSKNWKETSISAYMRTLRALYNRAIKEGIVSLDVYPFKDYKIGNLNLATQKRALTLTQIEAIEKVEVKENSRIWQSKNLFLFSYYTMGTNLVDMANLQWEDVIGGRLKYDRAKTHKPFNVILTDKAQAILDRYKAEKKDKYIFPIYSQNTHITAQQKNNRLHKVMGSTNKDLKEIAKLCGIEETLTTYVARHSAATILKRKGVSTSQISDLLGHETEEITQTYLDGFESGVLDSAVNLL